VDEKVKRSVDGEVDKHRGIENAISKREAMLTRQRGEIGKFKLI
jgi:hypothetical protein